MCLAAPSKVIALHGATALTECFGQTREVSLLLMEGDTQASYRHALPKTARAVGERINLTFRLIRPNTRRNVRPSEG